MTVPPLPTAMLGIQNLLNFPHRRRFLTAKMYTVYCNRQRFVFPHWTIYVILHVGGFSLVFCVTPDRPM
ncbi:hypothetical protein GDO78_012823 [Eleutherodactylus coqui]|uniref:Uncharacterized protein n=1 Tax=Eleutherodactylus coqui TaxID=57060 RepID=A0A8J6K4X5_ELECQ|nr:hypothetical protein GDO78_012823 [Eleutherodactylus coqui]